MVLETTRDRVAALVAAAIVLLVGRVLATRVGAPPAVERGLYLLALGCLFAGILVIVDESR
jgi:hypothetical protein